MVLFRAQMASFDTSLKALVRRLSEVSLIRFGVVGVSNTVLAASTFWAAHRVVKAVVAQSAAYTVGMLWSYYWNRRWTFQSQGRVASEAGRFFGLQIGFMLLSSALLYVLVDRGHWPSGPSWLGVTAVMTALNFVASRYWAFKPAV